MRARSHKVGFFDPRIDRPPPHIEELCGNICHGADRYRAQFEEKGTNAAISCLGISIRNLEGIPSFYIASKKVSEGKYATSPSWDG
jgi:hypothetical protein